jgi:hypothetical protein
VAERTAALEMDRAVLEAQKEELVANLEAARRSEARENAVAAQWRSQCDDLQRQLAMEQAAAEAARQAPQSAIDQEERRENENQALSASLDAARREHELRSALAASEHQRELDHANQEARIALLTQELNTLRQTSAQQQQEVTSLREENRTLQAELLSSFSVARDAAIDAATAAASSAAALEERSRATPAQGYALGILDSPAASIGAPPVARRLLQESESLTSSLNTTPSAQLRFAGETPDIAGVAAFARASRMLESSDRPSEFQDHLTPPRKKGATPMRLPNAGDVAAGGALRRTTAKAMQSIEAEAAQPMKDGDVDEADAVLEQVGDTYSPLSKPLLGGPLGLARALAMRRGANRSKSPLRRR